MKKKFYLSSNINELNISLTAYRALLVLGMLMERPLSREEIANILKENRITSKSFSLDTVRVTINTLKAAGCRITRPTLKNNYKYTLVSHPFRIEFSNTQLNCLNAIRNNLVQLGDWQLILTINDFYNKIVSKTQSESKMEIIRNAEPLIEIDKNMLKIISESSAKNKELIIDYCSSENGVEELRIIADRIFYEEGRLYLWCYSYKYDSYSYIRIDKIKTIKSISLSAKTINKSSYLATYNVKGDSMLVFKPAQNERIIDQDDKKILVEADVLNEFKFIQRLLLLGTDFSLVSPDLLKKKLISKLKSIKQGYSYEN